MERELFTGGGNSELAVKRGSLSSPMALSLVPCDHHPCPEDRILNGREHNDHFQELGIVVLPDLIDPG